MYNEPFIPFVLNILYHLYKNKYKENMFAKLALTFLLLLLLFIFTLYQGQMKLKYYMGKYYP